MKTLILAGGSGTRLLPFGREHYPEQFIMLFDDESLFQKTVMRSLLFSPPQDISIVTNKDQKILIRDQLEEIRCTCTILTKPVVKNTLPVIYFGVKTIADSEERENVAVVSSDHLIDVNIIYVDAFWAADCLAENYLVVLGVRPICSHTGYEYIRLGAEFGDGSLVDAFLEKPDAETAER